MSKLHTATERTLYHFTSRNHLSLIERAGVLETGESHVGSPELDWQPYGEHQGPDVVWLLDTPEFDGRTHGLPGSWTDKTKVRFTVHARAVRWLDWAPADRMHPEWRELFVDAGGGYSAAQRWWVSEQPIPRSAWIAIDEQPSES